MLTTQLKTQQHENNSTTDIRSTSQLVEILAYYKNILKDQNLILYEKEIAYTNNAQKRWMNKGKSSDAGKCGISIFKTVCRTTGINIFLTNSQLGNIRILKDKDPAFDYHNNLLLINKKDKEFYIYEPDDYINDGLYFDYLKPNFLRTLVMGAIKKLSSTSNWKIWTWTGSREETDSSLNKCIKFLKELSELEDDIVDWINTEKDRGALKLLLKTKRY
jgi:hypothetical protein